MNLFEIYPEMDQEKSFDNLLYKRVSFKNSENNYKLFGFDKCFKKRWKSLFKNFAIPFQQTNYFDNRELNQSCHCNECGGKVKKKILICNRELSNNQFSAIKSRYPASPKLSIQPQTVRPSNKDLSLIGSSAHFILYQLILCDKHQKQVVQRSARESLIPVIQLIQAQNLMKKISRTHKIEQDLKSKINTQTESLFNKVQKKLDDKEDIQSKHIETQIQKPKEIDFTKQRDLLKKKSLKQSPNSVQYRIKTDVSSYYFANQQKKPNFYLPNLSNLENLKKNSLSIFESKTPRMLIRSEKYNLKQPLTQRLLATYLKKSNSKLLNNNKKQ